MMVRSRPGWALKEADATPEAVFQRRHVLAAAAAAPLALGTFGWAQARAATKRPEVWAERYPAERNQRYPLERPLTDETDAITYNNFYEFGSHKNIWRAAQALPLSPWTITIDGLVEAAQTIDFDALFNRMPLEERLYRHRCVEAWAMAVPWTGFPMKALVDIARPLGSAKYVRMETFENASVAPGQRQFWYPWPYVEGLTIAEATNDLAFLVTGIYGKPLPPQNGAPLRLAVPWKYGFKSTKSIVRFTFTEERPVSFWETLQSAEYGFWANVNPEVPHPRWSQATERMLGTDERRPTVIYNGYGDFVAHLYAGLEDEPLFM